jgi:hypothetical protein
VVRPIPISQARPCGLFTRKHSSNADAHPRDGHAHAQRSAESHMSPHQSYSARTTSYPHSHGACAGHSLSSSSVSFLLASPSATNARSPSAQIEGEVTKHPRAVPADERDRPDPSLRRAGELRRWDFRLQPPS